MTRTNTVRACSFLGFLLAVFVAASARAEVAGRFLLAAGDVSILRAGLVLPAAARSEVRSGDLVRTGAASHAQLRFEDASLVALRPNTELRIDLFSYAGSEDGTERAFFTLLKGGLRALTGIIGRKGPEYYRLSTPAATLSRRGTHYSVLFCRGDCAQAKDGLYGNVLEGRVALVNEAKLERQFGAGEAFYVPDVRTPAERLIAPPEFLTDRLEGQVRARPGAVQSEAAPISGGVGLAAPLDPPRAAGASKGRAAPPPEGFAHAPGLGWGRWKDTGPQLYESLQPLDVVPGDPLGTAPGKRKK